MSITPTVAFRFTCTATIKGPTTTTTTITTTGFDGPLLATATAGQGRAAATGARPARSSMKAATQASGAFQLMATSLVEYDSMLST